MLRFLLNFVFGGLVATAVIGSALSAAGGRVDLALVTPLILLLGALGAYRVELRSRAKFEREAAETCLMATEQVVRLAMRGGFQIDGPPIELVPGEGAEVDLHLDLKEGKGHVIRVRRRPAPQ